MSTTIVPSDTTRPGTLAVSRVLADGGKEYKEWQLQEGSVSWAVGQRRVAADKVVAAMSTVQSKKQADKVDFIKLDSGAEAATSLWIGNESCLHAGQQLEKDEAVFLAVESFSKPKQPVVVAIGKAVAAIVSARRGRPLHIVRVLCML